MNKEEAELFNQFKMYFYKRDENFVAPTIYIFYSNLCQLCGIEPIDSPQTNLSLQSYYKSALSRDYINNKIEEIINQHGMDKILESFVVFGIFSTTQAFSKTQNYIKLNKLFHAIEAKKNELIDKTLSQKDPQKMQRLLNLLVFGYQSQIETCQNLYQNTIAYRFFNSSFHDLEINLSSLHEFYNKFNNTIPVKLKDKFEFFEKIHADITSDSLSDETFKHLFKQLKNLDNMGDLYDCLSFAKQTISKTLVSSLTKKEDLSSLQNPQDFEMEIPKDIKVLDLRGKNFKLLVTTIKKARSGMDDNSYLRNNSTKNDVASFSLISNDCLYTFRDLTKSTTFVYFDVDPKDIVHVTERDNYTYYNRNKTSISDLRFAMMTPDELLKSSIKSKKYNEINAHFPSKLNNLESNWSEEWCQSSFENPQGIFCLNEITYAEINLAKEYNLPIIYYEDRRYAWEGETLPCVDNEIIYDRT